MNASVSLAPLTSAERAGVVVEAICAFMKDRSGETLAFEELPGVVQCYQPDDREQAAWLHYFTGRGPKVAGYLKSDRGVIDQLKARGIISFQGELDSLTRIINTRWLESHADIKRHIDGAQRGERRCGFCRAPEDPMSVELINAWYGIDVAAAGTMTVNGVTQLQPRAVHVHRICQRPYHEWVAIAGQYASEDEAHKADKKAKRKSRELAPPPSRDPLSLELQQSPAAAKDQA